MMVLLAKQFPRKKNMFLTTLFLLFCGCSNSPIVEKNHQTIDILDKTDQEIVDMGIIQKDKERTKRGIHNVTDEDRERESKRSGDGWAIVGPKLEAEADALLLEAVRKERQRRRR